MSTPHDRLLAAAKSVLKLVEERFPDYEPTEESQHWNECPLADSLEPLNEEIVLGKCECSNGEMLRATVMCRALRHAVEECEKAERITDEVEKYDLDRSDA